MNFSSLATGGIATSTVELDGGQILGKFVPSSERAIRNHLQSVPLLAFAIEVAAARLGVFNLLRRRPPEET